MPVIYTIDVPSALIVTRCVGHVTLAEVRDHFRELARVWPPVERLNVLLDLTEQTSLPTLRELEGVAAEITAQLGPSPFGRCAVITEQDSLFESMEMFQVLVGHFFEKMEIFRTSSAAIAWMAPTTPNARQSLTKQ